MAAPVRGVVLAGGAGSRLGAGKPCVELAGRPLIEYPVAALQAAGLAVTVVAKRDTLLPAFGAAENSGAQTVELIEEPDLPLHPLRGIVSALESSGSGAAIVLACDMPFVTGALVAWLVGLDDAAVIAPEHDGRLQPMLGRYAPAALDALAAAMRENGSVQSAIERAGLRRLSDAELTAFGDPGRLLFDVDTPEDLARAEQLIAHDASSSDTGFS